MITQKIQPVCHKANPLPHMLSGSLEIGTIAPDTTVIVSIYSTSIGSTRIYDGTSNGAGLLTIDIPADHAAWYSAFEDCCYKITVLQDGCPIEFTIGGLAYDCVLMCLQIDCDAQAPHKLIVCAQEVDNNCNTCQ